MKKRVSLLAVLLIAVFAIGFVSWVAPTKTEAAQIATAAKFVPGEEYVLTMAGTKMWFNGTYVSANATYGVGGEVYKNSLVLTAPPTTLEDAHKSLWRISYATSTSTITM